MRNLIQELRYALRVLGKSPGYALSAVLVLTLGIGANTAIFGVVNAVLLKPLPFRNSGSIVQVSHVPPPQSFPGISTFPVSPANYLDWRKQSDVFESMAMIGGRNYKLTGTDRAQSVSATITEPDFFSVLQARPAFGRVFNSDETQPGRDDVTVLSHAFAQNQFGDASSAVGRTLTLEGRNYRVVGVMPADFRVASWFPAAFDIWTPLALTDQQRAVRKDHNFVVVARLKPGVDVKQAQAQMDLISSRLAQQYPEENEGWGANVISLRDGLVGRVRPALLTLLGAVAFVLLIACANVANLVLARTLARRKELAIRTALGASAAQALRSVLVETTLLSLAGGALGLMLAQSGQALVMGTLAREIPRSTEVTLDGWVLAFTLLVSVLTGLAAGMIGSWRLVRADINESLKQGLGKTDTDSGGNRTRSTLVAAEVALSLMLLIGAGLMIRSLSALRGADPGFDPENTVTMTIPIPRAKDGVERSRFYDEVLPAIRALPGVQLVGAIDTLPFQGGSHQPVVIPGRPAPVFALQPNIDVRRVTPGYVGAMRIPIVSGRDFIESDTLGKPAVVLVSESMAKQFWPNESPIGKRLVVSFTPDITREVVGVVGDIKQRGIDVFEPVPILYTPLLQSSRGAMSVVVRGSSDPLTLVPAITRAIQGIDPELPVRNVLTLDQLVANSMSERRFSMLLFAAFAGLAILLAAVGIYSVLSYSVRRRLQEISIRMALGAQVRDVIRLVVFEGMKPTLIGAALGVLGAYLLARLLSKMIYGVSTTDPLTFAAVVLLLGSVALLACLIPAYRATRVEPIKALRNE